MADDILRRLPFELAAHVLASGELNARDLCLAERVSKSASSAASE